MDTPFDFSQIQAPPSSAMAAPQDNSVALMRRLMDLKALAMSPDGRLQISGESEAEYRSTLVSTSEGVRRVELARHCASSLKLPLRIFACTEARAAVSVTTDADLRDRRFLTGSKTTEGHHVYCGGVDATISRALVYGQYADAVCFRGVNVQLSEATHFAAAFKASFPGKQVGFAHTPALTGVWWNERDHRSFEATLRECGYDFYLVTQFGQTVFPRAIASGAWVLLNDAAQNENAQSKPLPAWGSPTTRFSPDIAHSFARTLTSSSQQ